jgi:hypothetical protein
MAVINEIELLSQDRKNLHQNLLSARQPVKDLIFFALGDHNFDLPTAALGGNSFGEIPINNAPRGDILGIEAHALVRIFVFGHIPNLDRVKRVKILREILTCCNAGERNLLLTIITTRTIPGVTRQDVLAAYGTGWLDARPVPPAPPQPVAPAKAKTNRKVYEPFRPLKSLGIVQ